MPESEELVNEELINEELINEELINEELDEFLEEEQELNDEQEYLDEGAPPDVCDPCPATCYESQEPEENKIDEKEVERLLAAQEQQLCEEFDAKLKKEMASLIDRFDFILKNEQTRASFMQAQAYRERQEKIAAIQTQLECKNLAGMMFVLCSERRKSKLEKLKIIEEYSEYIEYLLGILTDAQDVILDLSRGYKTAARVDFEWREKMKKIMTEFQNFVYHFAGGPPETSQYFFDIPNILKTETPIFDDPKENPICRCDENVEKKDPCRGKEWWETLDRSCRPFIVFGDMAEFKPNRRRTVVQCLKAKKTAPYAWKEYKFDNMRFHPKCTNLDQIKDEYENFGQIPINTEMAMPSDEDPQPAGKFADPCSRRVTTASIDVRGMGSMFKIITQGVGQTQHTNKAVLLGARDSMEIQSTTRLREKSRQSMPSAKPDGTSDAKSDKLNVGSRRTSFLEGSTLYGYYDDAVEESPSMPAAAAFTKSELIDAESSVMQTKLGEAHTDSMELVEQHVPDKDHHPHYERVCPMEKCQRQHVNSFLRQLPAYMRANPFTQFQSTFEKYEACTPEQIAILKKKIEDRKRRERADLNKPDPTAEWAVVEGVAAQTSDLSVYNLPPCKCREPNLSPISSHARVFNVEELIPVKQKMDQIAKECFFDTEIDFNRFKVLGELSDNSLHEQKKPLDPRDPAFTTKRMMEIRKILKNHPSLCDIFQANLRC